MLALDHVIRIGFEDAGIGTRLAEYRAQHFEVDSESPADTETFRKAGGESAVDFLKITLTDLIVSSVAPSGANSGDNPIEAVSIAFAEYKVEYQEQDNKGAKKGGPIIAGFSIQKNAKTA